MGRVNARIESGRVIQAVRHIEKNQGAVHILHTHFYAAAAAGPVIARRLRIPWIHTEHSSSLAAPNPQEMVSTAGRAILNRVVSKSECVILVGQEQVDGLRRLGLSGDYLVIGNPVDATFFKARSATARSGRLVSVGSLILRKRHDLLIRAFAETIRRGYPRLRLDIVGDGPEEAALRRLAVSLGVAESVRFHGRLARPGVAAVLAQADLYIHCAEWESFGVAIVEALLAGTPVASTHCGGVTSLLPPTIGVVTDDVSIEGLVALIESGLSHTFADPSMMAVWAEAHFGIEAVAKQIEEAYSRVLGDFRNTRSTR